jgi:hypothetical protein
MSIGMNDCINSLNIEKKEWSVTESVYGRALPKSLIFREEFNSLDMDIWSHEITMGGGGVCTKQCVITYISCIKLFCLYRMENSKFFKTIGQIVM